MRSLRESIRNLGFTSAEKRKLDAYRNRLLSRNNFNGSDYPQMYREASLGVARDIQAQRLPPNIRVPSRKHPINYLKAVYKATGNFGLALSSYLCPGSWTSSGGSFKLAEDAGYGIVQIIMDKEDKQGRASLLEVGAGYAGFKSDEPKGVRKLVETAGDKMGSSVFADFTNLTNWHRRLPNGVLEHPGYAARDVLDLREDGGLDLVDIVYSQCAAYFEPRIEKFVRGSAELLRDNGMLIFNAKPSDEERIIENAEKSGLQLDSVKELGNSNGNFYVFRKR